jgi:large subunit ribosomal protein L24
VSVKKIKKNDVVMVISGSNQGKTGKVLQVFPVSGRAVVEGVNLVRKHLRKTQERPQGGIADKEAPMALSKVMLHCPACKKGVKITRAKEAGKSIRKCRKCGHSFDA